MLSLISVTEKKFNRKIKTNTVHFMNGNSKERRS
jgi:hypothetical protein